MYLHALEQVGGHGTQPMFTEDQLAKLQEYIEEAPHRIKVGCFAGGAAIVLNGLLSVIDIFDATWSANGPDEAERFQHPKARKHPEG